MEPECVRIASSEQNSSKDSARIALFGQIEDGGFQTSPKNADTTYGMLQAQFVRGRCCSLSCESRISHGPIR